MCMWNVLEHSGKARDWSGLVGSVAAALIRMDIIRDIYVYISVVEINIERYVYICIECSSTFHTHKEIWRGI